MDTALPGGEAMNSKPGITKHFVFRKVEMPYIEQRGANKYGYDQYWYAELHLGNFGIYGPAALAVIKENEVLELFVLDSVRGRGYGTALIKAAGKKFGPLHWCDTDESRGFHQSLVAKGIARVVLRHDSGNKYEFIPKRERTTPQNNSGIAR